MVNLQRRSVFLGWYSKSHFLVLLLGLVIPIVMIQAQQSSPPTTNPNNTKDNYCSCFTGSAWNSCCYFAPVPIGDSNRRSAGFLAFLFIDTITVLFSLQHHVYWLSARIFARFKMTHLLNNPYSWGIQCYWLKCCDCLSALCYKLFYIQDRKSVV